MLRDAPHRTVILKALDPLDPIEWNAPLGANWLAFNRRSRRGFTIPWQFPKPRPAGSKSVPDRLYAKSALCFSERLRRADALTLAEQSFRSGPRLEFGHAQCTDSERISQEFSHEHFRATARHVYSHLSRTEGSRFLPVRRRCSLLFGRELCAGIGQCAVATWKGRCSVSRVVLFSKAIIQAEWAANAPLRESMAIKRERLRALRAKRAAKQRST